MNARMTVPFSTLSAPAGSHVVAVIGGDGCAAVPDAAAPGVALAAGTVVLVSSGSSLPLVWSGTCGWTAWCVDAPLLQRAAARAGLAAQARERVAALFDDAAVGALMTALALESRGAHAGQRVLVQSLAEALGRRATVFDAASTRGRAA
jgi:hypothetical protein